MLDDISFSIGTGEVVAFLGNNGAGKSTTMKIITGYLTPDKGRVEVCGVDVAANPMECHRRIGYLPEHNPIYPEMYVKEYLLFIAGVYKLGKESRQRVDEMIERTGLTREYKKKIGMLSKGYRQRVGLAQALIPNPDVLILDEPTTGLDPNQIIGVRELIKEVGREKTVMLSTHIMQEVSAICDRVIILNKGRIAADGKESQMVNTDNGAEVSILIELAHPADVSFLSEMPNVLSVNAISDTSFAVSAAVDVREDLFRACAMRNLPLVTLKLHERSMEEVFRTMTK